jgi:hypothetical protein
MINRLSAANINNAPKSNAVPVPTNIPLGATAYIRRAIAMRITENTTHALRVTRSISFILHQHPRHLCTNGTGLTRVTLLPVMQPLKLAFEAYPFDETNIDKMVNEIILILSRLPY